MKIGSKGGGCGMNKIRFSHEYTKLHGQTSAEVLNPETFLVSPLYCEPLPNRMRSYADRIEAAYKRLTIPTPEQWTEIARQGSEIADLKRENASLRAALKSAIEKDGGK